jgi:hypothetical protein
MPDITGTQLMNVKRLLALPSLNLTSGPVPDMTRCPRHGPAQCEALPCLWLLSPLSLCAARSNGAATTQRTCWPDDENRRRAVPALDLAGPVRARLRQLCACRFGGAGRWGAGARCRHMRRWRLARCRAGQRNEARAGSGPGRWRPLRLLPAGVLLAGLALGHRFVDDTGRRRCCGFRRAFRPGLREAGLPLRPPQPCAATTCSHRCVRRAVTSGAR